MLASKNIVVFIFPPQDEQLPPISPACKDARKDKTLSKLENKVSNMYTLVDS